MASVAPLEIQKAFWRELNDPRHGSLSAYTYLRCRCEKCKQANTDYRREHKRKKSAADPRLQAKRQARVDMEQARVERIAERARIKVARESVPKRPRGRPRGPLVHGVVGYNRNGCRCDVCCEEKRKHTYGTLLLDSRSFTSEVLYRKRVAKAFRVTKWTRFDGGPSGRYDSTIMDHADPTGEEAVLRTEVRVDDLPTFLSAARQCPIVPPNIVALAQNGDARIIIEDAGPFVVLTKPWREILPWVGGRTMPATTVINKAFKMRHHGGGHHKTHGHSSRKSKVNA